MKNECKHNKLFFGSGDYYIFCEECGRSWTIEGEVTFNFHDDEPRRVKPGVMDELIRLQSDEI